MLKISPLSHIRFSLSHVGSKESLEVCGLTSHSEQDGCQHSIRSARSCAAWETSLDGDNAMSGQPVPEVYSILSNEVLHVQPEPLAELLSHPLAVKYRAVTATSPETSTGWAPSTSSSEV